MEGGLAMEHVNGRGEVPSLTQRQDSVGNELETNYNDSQTEEGRKIRRRRTFSELKRDVLCPFDSCGRVYASKHALQQHVRLKHSQAGGDATSVSVKDLLLQKDKIETGGSGNSTPETPSTPKSKTAGGKASTTKSRRNRSNSMPARVGSQDSTRSEKGPSPLAPSLPAIPPTLPTLPIVPKTGTEPKTLAEIELAHAARSTRIGRKRASSGPPASFDGHDGQFKSYHSIAPMHMETDAEYSDNAKAHEPVLRRNSTSTLRPSESQGSGPITYGHWATVDSKSSTKENRADVNLNQLLQRLMTVQDTNPDYQIGNFQGSFRSLGSNSNSSLGGTPSRRSSGDYPAQAGGFPNVALSNQVLRSQQERRRATISGPTDISDLRLLIDSFETSKHDQEQMDHTMLLDKILAVTDVPSHSFPETNQVDFHQLGGEWEETLIAALGTVAMETETTVLEHSPPGEGLGVDMRESMSEYEITAISLPQHVAGNIAHSSSVPNFHTLGNTNVNGAIHSFSGNLHKDGQENAKYMAAEDAMSWNMVMEYQYDHQSIQMLSQELRFLVHS